MAKADELIRFFDQWVVSKEPNEKGEYRMLCPLHKERRPSATINFGKGVFHCNSSSCVGGMTIRKLKQLVEAQFREEGQVASYDPFETDSTDSNVIDIKTRTKVTTPEKEPLTEGKIRAWHRGLLGNEKTLNRFISKRGLTIDSIKKFEIGIDLRTERYTIPVRDINGTLVNVRRYKLDGDTSQKMWNWPGLGSPPRLFPVAVMEESDLILLVEGELDAIIASQYGFAAVTGTGGARRWDPSWSKQFEDKLVCISYDNDSDGRIGGKKASKSIVRYAKEVRILPPLMDEHKSDITDFFLAGGTTERLKEIIDSTESISVEAESDALALGIEATPIEVIGSMDSTTNGKPLQMVVTVVGKKNPTYSFPRQADMSCTMDAGPKCQGCPMLLEHEGDYKLEIGPRDVENLARFVDKQEDQRLEVARKIIGAQKCNRLKMKVTQPQTVEELFVAASIEHRSTDASDYTQRRIYNVGPFETNANTVAKIVGTTWPSVKDGRNEFFSWRLDPAVTSIDSFEITPDIANQLKIFQPAKGQNPIDKAREIALELTNVTGIIGRERMQMAMDLVYHSAIGFSFAGKKITRGWLEFIVVGDTRTGKSETAIRLAEYYGLGHVIGCEGATFAGLVGGVKQIGNEWTITWGEIPLNDRRLVVLDEFGGLSYDIISQLSDIRARGIAQVTKVETSQTLARCRMICMANPRKSKFIDEKKIAGIDIIQDVVGNQEDIARFDFAMSVKSSDVPSKKINVVREAPPEPKYTSQACHNLILWVWSRKPEDVVFVGKAEETIMAAAEWLGQNYIEDPPLLQVQSSREKVARLSVAMAARVFSTDETMTKIIVKEEHVKAVVNFLNKLYSYDNFGYRRVSDRLKRNQKTAEIQRPQIRMWLLENPKLLEFLLDKTGSFRAQDLEEMAFMQRDDVNMALGRLSAAKMISKSKSQIVLEPELQSLLLELERKRK